MIKTIKATVYECSDGQTFQGLRDAALNEASSQMGKFATAEQCEAFQNILKLYNSYTLAKFSTVLSEYLDGLELRGE